MWGEGMDIPQPHADQPDAAASWSKAQAIPTVASSVAVHFILGSLYTWGNLEPYVASYMREVGGLNIQHRDLAVTLSGIYGGQAMGMLVAGPIETLIGPGGTTFIGILLLSASVLTASYVLASYWAFIAIYGFMYGVGLGIAYTAPISCSMKWLPRSKGLVTGLVTAGLGTSALLLNQFHTWFINPMNILPVAVSNHPDQLYFTDVTLLRRIPRLIAISAAVYLGVGAIACFWLRNPPICHAAAAELPLGRDDVELVGERYKMRRRRRSIVRTRQFGSLALLFYLNGLAITFVAATWKTGAGARFYNDQFLSGVGSLASVTNALGRILWGTLADRTSPRLALLCLSATWTLALLSLGAMAAVRFAPAFAGLIALNFFCLGGNFSLFPTALAVLYGETAITTAYGILYLTNSTASFTSAFLIKALPLEPSGLCMVYAASVGLGCILLMFRRSALQPQLRDAADRSEIVPLSLS